MSSSENPRHALTLQYSETLVRSGSAAYWRLQMGIAFPLCGLGLAILGGYLLVDGDRGWRVGAIAFVVTLSVIASALLYVVTMRRSLARFRAMAQPTATLELDDQGLRLTSDLGSSDLHWTLVRKVWRMKDAWLLEFTSGSYITLPGADLPGDARAFIERKVLANGGRIA